jgi:hypothetical protein
MLVHRMVKKVKDSKVWAKINTKDESDRLESLKRQLAQAKQTGGDKDYEKELEDEIKELEAQYQREGLTKDADPRGYKVSDQIIKGFLIYKSGKGPATFFAKNENGKEFEGSMEEIKKQIDDYWVKQDEDVMKQKMKDGEKVDEGVYKGKKYWIKSAFPRITYRGYIQGVRGVICEEISLKNVEKGIFYYIDHQMGKDSNKTKDEVFTDPRYVIYHTKWKGLDISQLKDKTIVWENNRQLKSINGGDYDALAKAQDWIDAFRRKTKDALTRATYMREKDQLMMKVKDASQAYLDGYAAARSAYGKHTNPVKDDPAKAAEWDKGWEDGKADKDELSAKGSGQEFVKHGSHFKDAKPKHPRWRIKDDKLFRLRSAIKKAKTKDVELSNRAVWRKEDFDKMVAAGNFTIVSKQPWGYEVKVKSGNIYDVEVKDSKSKDATIEFHDFNKWKEFCISKGYRVVKTDKYNTLAHTEGKLMGGFHSRANSGWVEPSVQSARYSYGSKDFKDEAVQMQCNECGKRFKKNITSSTVEVQCPACGGYDTDVDEPAGKVITQR